jgi:hypothetical protein
MKFKTKKIATAVAVGLGASVVGMNVAQSDELMFPYVVSSPTVTTVLSVVNDADETLNPSLTTIDNLHYAYWYKSGAASENKGAVCVEVNDNLVSSPNDVVTFSVDGAYGAATAGVLFEPEVFDSATRPDAKAKYDLARTFALLEGVTQPIRSFALVDNNAFFEKFFDTAVAPSLSPSGLVAGDFGETLSGEAIVLEFGSGAAWGYRAYNPAGIYGIDGVGTYGRLNPFDFSDRVETTGEVLSGPTPMAVAPFMEEGGEFSTRLFVTPVSTFQSRGDLTTTVRFQVRDENSFTSAMYDRDENPVSGQVPMDVTCVAGLNAHAMLTEGAQNRLGTGGWTNVTVTDPGVADNEVGEAVVIKLEFNDATGTFNGEPLPGVYNNSIWLTKGIRETLPRPVSVYEVPDVPLVGPQFGAGQDESSPCPLLQPEVGDAGWFAPGPACAGVTPTP